MPFFLGLRSKSVRSTSEDNPVIPIEAPGLVPRKLSVSSRATKKVLEQTLRQANSICLDHTTQSMPSRHRPSLPPPTHVGWGSLDPSIPKKTSLTRRTLHPDARDPTSSYHFRESRFEDQASTRRHSGESSTCSQKHRSQMPANEQHQALLPKRMASVRRRSLTSRPSSTVTIDEQKLKHQYSKSLPISRFNTSSGALARAANKAASLTCMEAAQHSQRQLNGISEDEPYHQEPRSSADSSDDTVLIRLDSNSIQNTPVDGLPVNVMTRAERHAANKRLYHRMKAENHNLWVLLDASNRRADFMQQTLQTEEKRCQSLEQRAQQLQSTLDTLNRRRLMLENQTDSVYTQQDVAEKRQSNAGEVEAVTAELDYLRKNLAQSRNSIRKLRGAASQPPPPVPRVPSRYDKELPIPQAEIDASIREEIFSRNGTNQAGDVSPSGMTEQRFSQVDKLDSHLHHLVKPKPVRPDKHCSTEAALLEHINTITETAGYDYGPIAETAEHDFCEQGATRPHTSDDHPEAPFTTPPSTPPPKPSSSSSQSHHLPAQIHELPDTSIIKPTLSRSSSTSSGYSSYGPTSSSSDLPSSSTTTSPTETSSPSRSRSGSGDLTIAHPKPLKGLKQAHSSTLESYAEVLSRGPYAKPTHSSSSSGHSSLRYAGSVPDLSSSYGTSSSSDSDSVSGPPTPPLPPRSEKRLRVNGVSGRGTRNVDGVSVADVAGKGQSHIHPALRIDTSCAPKGQPVGQLGEVVEVAGEERGEMEVGLGIKGLDLAV